MGGGEEGEDEGFGGTEVKGGRLCRLERRLMEVDLLALDALLSVTVFVRLNFGRERKEKETSISTRRRRLFPFFLSWLGKR